jgi:uncharacterized membrane-anchored protein YhcB (DUF1043 family)
LNVSLIILVITFLAGVLIGYTSTERLLEVRTKRQAAAQRSLNSQQHALAIEWQELEAARREIAERLEGELRRPITY